MSKRPTPGPWHLETLNLNDNQYEYVIRGRMGQYVTSLGAANDPQTWYDAHLIKAAPKLYDACAEFVRKVECGEARSTRSYEQMKAAMADAQGKTP